MGKILIGLLLVLSTIACSSPASPDPTGTIRVSGTVQYQTLEGGFWAIRGDDGRNYDPTNLSPAFQRENLRVSMVARVRDDMVSIHMWGHIVDIISIQPL